MYEQPNNPSEYSEEILKSEMQEWANQREDDWYKSLPEIILFGAYQNNFYTRLETALRLYNPDGSIKPGEEQWEEHYRKTHGNMYRDLMLIIEKLGLDPEAIKGFGKDYSNLKRGSRLTDEELEMVKRAFIEMRKKGYSRIDLI